MVYFLWRQQSLPGNQSEKPRGLGQSPSGILAAHYRKKNGNPTSFMPLPRKQTMNGSEVSSTCVMVSLSRFKKKYKGDLIIIVAQEILSCPCCEGDLFVRGTCRRQAINSAGSKVQYQLRVRLTFLFLLSVPESAPAFRTPPLTLSLS